MGARTGDLTAVVTVRFKADVAAQLDAVAKELTGGVAGLELGRSDAVRVLVAEALAARAKKKKRRKS